MAIKHDNNFPGKWCCAHGEYLYGYGVVNVTDILRKGVTGQAYVTRGTLPDSKTVERICSIKGTGTLLVVAGISSAYTLLRSVDGGQNFATVFTFGDGNGAAGVQTSNVGILGDICEAKRALPDGSGTGSLFLGEYNVASSRTAGGTNDRVRLMRSDDDGATWQKVTEWNSDGTSQVGHIHNVLQDPYTGHIYVCVGDANSASAIIQWDGVTEWPNNLTHTELAALDGFNVVHGAQRHRTVGLIFTEDCVFTFSDTQTPNNPTGSESGIWRLERDFSSFTRVDNQIHAYDPMHIGWFGENIGGVLVWTTAREYIDPSNRWEKPNIQFYMSVDGGASWHVAGEMRTRIPVRRGDISVVGSDQSLNSTGTNAFYGLNAGNIVTVSGFTNAANNGEFTVVSVSGDKKKAVLSGGTLVDEAVGNPITVMARNNSVYSKPVFQHAGKLYVDGVGFAGQYGAQVFTIDDSAPFADEILHPVYYVGEWNAAGRSASYGYSPDDPMDTLATALTNKAVSGGLIRVADGAQVFTWKAYAQTTGALLPAIGATVIEGVSKSTTVLQKTNSESYAFYLEAARTCFDQNNPLVFRNIKIWSPLTKILALFAGVQVEVDNAMIGDALSGLVPVIENRGRLLIKNAATVQGPDAAGYSVIDCTNAFLSCLFSKILGSDGVAQRGTTDIEIYNSIVSYHTIYSGSTKVPKIKNCFYLRRMHDTAGLTETDADIDYNYYTVAPLSVANNGGSHSITSGDPHFVNGYDIENPSVLMRRGVEVEGVCEVGTVDPYGNIVNGVPNIGISQRADKGFGHWSPFDSTLPALSLAADAPGSLLEVQEWTRSDVTKRQMDAVSR